MSDLAKVTVHSSQFPDAVRGDLIESLRSRRVNHKFHYDSVKQTQKWLALHQAHSPSRNDADCAAIYDQAFAEVAKTIRSRAVHLIGLGCGGGQKDTRLLKLLRARGRELFYTPCDVSTAMTLVARDAAVATIPRENCFPLVCDLASARDLAFISASRPEARAQRLFTFFGMIPNFEPADILPKLSALVRSNDILLFSANLSPGRDYAAGMKRILPQYDNALTRDWLSTFLLDLGVKRRDGGLSFGIRTGAIGIKRVVARFRFYRARTIEIQESRFRFRPGESIRLFFSYRYTPERVASTLAKFGLAVRGQWIAGSGEEGVFLVAKPDATGWSRIRGSKS